MKNFNQALSYSFLLLKYRARSKVELIQRLREKQCSLVIARQVVQYLEKSKYLDDREFARLFILNAVERGWSPRKVDFRLKQLGIANNLRKLTSTLNTAFKKKLRQTAEERLAKFKKQKPELSSKEVSQKVMWLLLSRGFDYPEVQRIIDDLGENGENC